jgi:hypothetical protein
MTIIFITAYPFNEDYALRYDFDILKRKGFKIIILNIARFVYSESIEKIPSYNKLDPVSGVNQERVESGKELEERLRNIESPKIVLLMTFKYRLLRIIKRAKVDYMRMVAAIPPIPHSDSKRQTFYQRTIRTVKSFKKRPGPYFFAILQRIFSYSLLGLNYPKYLIVHSNEAYRNCRYSVPEDRIIRLHSFDWDRYLKNKNMPRPDFIPDGNYYVFIADTPWGGHDYHFHNVAPVISKSEYSEIINSFFDFVESETGQKILIAAHPKHTREDNVYHGRPLYHFQTEQLIKYSTGVICHYSTAINFVVIHNKPLCMISMTKLKQDSYFHQYITAYEAALGTKIYYIDVEEDLGQMMDDGMFSYNPDIYEAFKKRYIVGDDFDETLYWERITDVLLQEYSTG